MEKILTMQSEFLTSSGLAIQKRGRNYDYPIHVHEFFEIEYIYSGKGEMLINGKSYEINPHSLFFLTPMDFQALKITEPIKTINISFNESWVAEDVKNALDACIVLYDFESAFFEAMYREYSDEKPGILNYRYTKSLLNCLLIQILRSVDSVSDSYENTSYIYKTRKYIHLHFKLPISIEQLANNVNLSPNYLCMIFHKEIGKTILEYITDFRLSFAAKLCSYTDTPITQICFESGFQSYSHFTRVFKAKYGLTPTQFRREKLKSEIKFEKPVYPHLTEFDEPDNVF